MKIEGNVLNIASKDMKVVYISKDGEWVELEDGHTLQLPCDIMMVEGKANVCGSWEQVIAGFEKSKSPYCGLTVVGKESLQVKFEQVAETFAPATWDAQKGKDHSSKVWNRELATVGLFIILGIFMARSLIV